jgi:hypothetical protein
MILSILLESELFRGEAISSIVANNYQPEHINKMETILLDQSDSDVYIATVPKV